MSKKSKLTDDEVGALTYQGNTVSYIKQRANAYGDEIMRCWGVLRDAGQTGRGVKLHEVIRAILAAEREPVAWQWRKRCHGWTDPDGTKQMVWTEWEALQPPYMDARQLAQTDPENYELRPLYL